jgi:hypothetical protein
MGQVNISWPAYSLPSPSNSKAGKKNQRTNGVENKEVGAREERAPITAHQASQFGKYDRGRENMKRTTRF